jgi:SWI/SNF-related matrix-associated actin-dependent regulator 1 of chromatin subfamily A|tara:strand:- start:1777 stop:3516 length:1740 start_codon:yes stop_codon:yes gene_type:complete
MELNLPEIEAKKILSEYSGANNYILQLKSSHELYKSKTLTRSQSDYVINNHNKTPKVARKWVEIDDYFSESLMVGNFLKERPKSIWVEKILSESPKAFHIWGKVLESQKIHSFWAPKNQLIPNTERKVVVDYSPYSHRTPYDHQKIAIEKLLGNDKYILADDMGVGKTTSATIAALESNAKKILIICPATLKLNWKREVENYSGDKISIVEGKKWDSGKFVIINYDILKNFHSLDKKDNITTIIDESFDLVIIDEAHYISNSKAQRTKLANDIVKKIGKVWLLTGTPMTSRPMNYYNILKLVESRVAKNWISYVKRYCEGYQINKGGRKIWLTNGASNLDELRDRTKQKVLRRLKEEILDLPDKIITPIFLELHSKEYKKEVGEYLDWANENKSKSLTIQLSKLMKVRQLIAKEKLNSTFELIDQCLEQDKKVIVFTNFTEPLMEIWSKYKKVAVPLYGKMNQEQRQVSVDSFQNDPKIKIFVSNIKAGGVGITLTKAEVVIFNDLSFVPADMSQAEDRAFRIGQKKNVSCLYPIFDNTVEKIIYNMVQRKKRIIDAVLGDHIEDEDLILNLLEEMQSL